MVILLEWNKAIVQMCIYAARRPFEILFCSYVMFRFRKQYISCTNFILFPLTDTRLSDADLIQ